ncbi:MAG: ABC transporter ATP-binding protein [Eubacteriales bacterium]|nr:ABC transporter ATP-binding protein [Eubacteriales bacterium]NCC81905.1 ABC transporter ATP-binding protein [Clostridia bacterium]
MNLKENDEKLIDIRNLTITTSSGQILIKDITLDMEKGEILGVVGESSSGKSLTAKSILNLLPEGLHWEAEKFQVMGLDYLKEDPDKIRSFIGEKIGYIPQNTGNYLHPMIKIKDQIADGYVLYAKESMEEALARAAKLVSAVGIRDTDRLLNSYPWQLSGGMRQRVNIAMALMNKPRMIIADEPTAALDSTVQRQVIDLFKIVNQNHNTSVLMISHDFGLIKYYCERILVVYAGQIMEEADRDELFNNPKHPYTKALIKVIPSLNIKKDERLQEIKGNVPDMRVPVKGCVFKDRCPYRKEICDTEVEDKLINENHYYKCHFDL